MKHLTKEQLKNDLEIRDLSDKNQGEHCMQLIMNEVIDALKKYWNCPVTIYRENPIVTVWENYDKLKIDKESVLRSEVYTRYVDDNHVLRTMASVMVPRGLQSIKDDIKPNHLLACVGLVYRRDQIDRVHSGVHHQMDLWYTSETPVTDDDMKKMIDIIVKVVTGNDNTEYITLPRVHPYTAEGREIDIMLDGKPLEILECGLTNPKILEENGCKGKYGLALGLGLERILMVRKGIKDIRLLRSTNEKVLCQMNDLEPYKEVSCMPAVVRDISVVVDKNLDIELLGDMVRESGVDVHLIEEVIILSETPYEELPDTAKQRLGIEEREKNILVRIVLRSLERTLTNEECNTYRDIIYRHISTKDGYLSI
jgi:phenylalanyl-tRNA synthetase alpha chain